MTDPNVTTPEATYGPTFYFGITIPQSNGSSLPPIAALPNSSITSPMSPSTAGSTFHFHITFNPTSASHALTQALSPIMTTSNASPDAAQREVELKQQLHQRKQSQTGDHHCLSSHRSSVSNTSLTPSASASNSQSDHYSSDPMEISTVEQPNTVDRTPNEISSPPKEAAPKSVPSQGRYRASFSNQGQESPLPQPPTSIPGPQPRDAGLAYGRNDRPPQISSTHPSRVNLVPGDAAEWDSQSRKSSRSSRSRSWSDREHRPRLDTATSTRHYKQARTPPGTPPRQRNQSLERENVRYSPSCSSERGRTRYSKSIRSVSRSVSHSRTYSPSPRNRTGIDDPPHNSFARKPSPRRMERSESPISSRSNSSRGQLIVSKAPFSGRSLSNSTDASQRRRVGIDSRRNDSRDRGSEIQTRIPLSSRIDFAGLVASDSQRGVICPFFHPESQKHPLGTTHPGYRDEEFERIKHMWTNGHLIPAQLLKSGDSINYRQRTEVHPTAQAKFSQAPKTTHNERLQYRRGQKRPSQLEPNHNRAWQTRNAPVYNNRNSFADLDSQTRYAQQTPTGFEASYQRPHERILRPSLPRPRPTYQPYSRQNMPNRGPAVRY